MDKYFFIENFQDQLDEYSKFYRCDVEICGLTSKTLIAQPESDKIYLFFAVFLMPIFFCIFLFYLKIKNVQYYYFELFYFI